MLPSWKLKVVWLGGALLVATAAQAKLFSEEDFEEEDKPWQEIVAQLPTAPQQENLLSFELGPLSTYRFAIDAKSLSVGEDGVVRYTLLSFSPAGAKNVSFEGIRCESYERKLYAFGHPDGTWSRSRRNQWERINSMPTNDPHATLFKDYFCEGTTVAGSADAILDRLRHKRTASSRITN